MTERKRRASRGASLVPRARPSARAPAAVRPAFAGRAVECAHCSVFAICVPAVLSGATPAALETLVDDRRLVDRGATVFDRGDPATAIYAVKSGAIKTEALLGRGPRPGCAPATREVVDYHLPGDLVGLDALGAARHPHKATALQTASLCEMPRRRLDRLARDNPALHDKLLQVVGASLRGHIHARLRQHEKSAERRVSAFLVEVSRRHAERGFSPHEYRLPMSRADIGSYLGLTKETVCRQLGALAARGWIEVAGKRVRLLRPDALEAAAVMVLEGG